MTLYPDTNTSWLVAATLLSGLIVWFFTNLSSSRKEPKLITYYGHVSKFQIKYEGVSPPPDINTHSIVLQNSGNVPVTNIRMRHKMLPENIAVFPPCDYQIMTHPDGAKDILIPKMVKGEQITVSYLYFPPITYDQINFDITHDGGYANGVTLLPTPQYPPWLSRLAVGFMYLGILVSAILLVAVVVQALQWLSHLIK